MKHKMTENLGLKIIALFSAALLWLIVVNVDDPVDTATYRDVPVSVTYEEVVTNAGKTYQIVDDTQTVSVVVSARRSVLSRISADDITAVADMREMELMSLVPVTVTVEGYEGRYQSAEADPKNIQVKIEDQTKNTFPLTVMTTGTLRDGYILGEVKTNPETITIRGSESLVGSIDKAEARVDVSGLSKDTELAAELLLYDAEGNVIDQTLLTNNLGEEGVSVSIQVLGTKSLPLEFETPDVPEEGYVCSGLTSEPEQAEVCGTKEVLESLDHIRIPAQALETEFDGSTGMQEIVVDVTRYLPEGVRLVDETANNVIVTLSIEQEGTRTVEFPVENIVVNNLSDQFRVSYGEVEDLHLRFTGSQEILENLDIHNAVSIDLQNYTEEGSYEVPVSVTVPDSVSLTEQPRITVILTEKEEE